MDVKFNGNISIANSISSRAQQNWLRILDRMDNEKIPKMKNKKKMKQAKKDAKVDQYVTEGKPDDEFNLEKVLQDLGEPDVDKKKKRRPHL